MFFSDSAFLRLGFFYLFAVFMAVSYFSADGNSLYYVLVAPFFVYGVFLVILRVGVRFSVSAGFLLLLLFVGAVLCMPPFEKSSIYARSLFFEMLLLFFLLSSYRFSMSDFSDFINVGYAFYLGISLLIWAGLIPAAAGEKNSFMVSLAGVSVETLYGIGGSTADIDSYSGLILMWNLFVNRGGRYRLVMIGLSAVAMLLTFRFTPIVALLAACLSYLFVRNRLLAMLALVLPAVGFVCVLSILHINPTAQVPFMAAGSDWYSLLWKGTHARSSIWVGQVNYYLTEFRFSDFFFGPMDERMTVDFIDGDGRFHKDSYNPHNTYLALLFHSTVLFAFFYLLFLWGVFRRARVNTFPVIFFISIVCYTNASIIGLQNPAFLMVTMFLLTAVPLAPFSEQYRRPLRGWTKQRSDIQGQVSC
jgi:hypothetical protein